MRGSGAPFVHPDRSVHAERQARQCSQHIFSALDADAARVLCAYPIWDITEPDLAG